MICLNKSKVNNLMKYYNNTLVHNHSTQHKSDLHYPLHKKHLLRKQFTAWELDYATDHQPVYLIYETYNAFRKYTKYILFFFLINSNLIVLVIFWTDNDLKFLNFVLMDVNWLFHNLKTSYVTNIRKSTSLNW